MELVKDIVLLMFVVGVGGYLAYLAGFKKGMMVGATEAINATNMILALKNGGIEPIDDVKTNGTGGNA